MLVGQKDFKCCDYIISEEGDEEVRKEESLSILLIWATKNCEVGNVGVNLRELEFAISLFIY